MKFRKLLLTPYDLGDAIPPHVGFQSDWFTILEEIDKQAEKCFVAHRYSYPKNQKEVLVVPVKEYAQAKEQGLGFLDYAVLYMPDIINHTKDIQSWNPGSGDPGCIVAYDHLISVFAPGRILGVDVSMGDPLFLWKECTVSPFNFPDTHYLLMQG